MRKLLRFLLAAAVAAICGGIVPVQAEGSDTEASFSAYTDPDVPSAQSEYVYLMDADSGQVLLNKNGDEKMFPASLTKIMTEILAIENLPDLDAQVTITSQMLSGLAEANASVAGFSAGDQPTVRDLLYGCALPSGADAVNALCYTVAGSVSDFVAMMNEKAAELGMNATHFVNATGLHDENHYSSARDIAILYSYCLKNDVFQQLISAPSYTSTTGLTLTSTVWRSASSFGLDAVGFEGGKTGWTPQAGRCLASSARIGDMHLVLVSGQAEGSGNFADASLLYSWFQDHYEKKTLLSAGQKVGRVEVLDSFDGSEIVLTNVSDVVMDLPKDAVIDTQLSLPENNAVYAPVAAGDTLGTLSVTVNGQTVYETDLVSDVSLSRSTLAYILRRVRENPVAAGGAAACVVMIAALMPRRR